MVPTRPLLYASLLAGCTTPCIDGGSEADNSRDESDGIAESDQDTDATKWLLASRMASKKRGFGYVGPKTMEVIQAGNHFMHGKWLSYTSPKMNRRGRTTMSLFSLLDKRVPGIVKRYLGNLLKNPASLFEPVHMPSFMIIQPFDVLPDGRTSMCDGCSDITVHEGELYWSCRLEEIKEYGCFLQGVKPDSCSAGQTRH